jgi:cholesterol transport system auxiliary component
MSDGRHEGAPMMRRPALPRLALVGACALALSGCISLLPKSKPSQLYRFGGATNAEAAAPATPGQVGVLRAGGVFQRESAGDRILTVTDGKVAYIAESRWVAPAAVLWDEALTGAFDGDNGKVRLRPRAQPASPPNNRRDYVRTTAPHNAPAPPAAPTVLVRVRASLVGRTGTAAGEQLFEARKPAGDNRVGAIVSAYDAAVRDVLGQLVTWTDAQAKPQA